MVYGAGVHTLWAAIGANGFPPLLREKYCLNGGMTPPHQSALEFDKPQPGPDFGARSASVTLAS